MVQQVLAHRTVRTGACIHREMQLPIFLLLVAAILFIFMKYYDGRFKSKPPKAAVMTHQ
jgi:hypothetical protein